MMPSTQMLNWLSGVKDDVVFILPDVPKKYRQDIESAFRNGYLTRQRIENYPNIKRKRCQWVYQKTDKVPAKVPAKVVELFKQRPAKYFDPSHKRQESWMPATYDAKNKTLSCDYRRTPNGDYGIFDRWMICNLTCHIVLRDGQEFHSPVVKCTLESKNAPGWKILFETNVPQEGRIRHTISIWKGETNTGEVFYKWEHDIVQLAPPVPPEMPPPPTSTNGTRKKSRWINDGELL